MSLLFARSPGAAIPSGPNGRAAHDLDGASTRPGTIIRRMDNHATRRETLCGLAATSLVTRTVKAESAPSSVPWMSTIEMARLIRTKKLSAREALAEHLQQIDR